MNLPIGTWVLSDSQVCVCLESGETTRVTAREIAGAQYKDRFQLSTCRVESRPSEVLSEIRFRRDLLEPRVTVSMPSASTGRTPLCWLELHGGPSPIRLPEIPAEDLDQIVHEGNWYLVATDSYPEIRKVLAGIGVRRPGPLSIRGYLDIACQEKGVVDLVDLSSDDTELPGRNEFFATLEGQQERRETSGFWQGFNGVLYDYQQEGVDWLLRVCDEELGCILGDEMGLGKTVQVIVVLLREIFEGRKPSLVIAPASLLENWRREMKQFAPSLNVQIHRGGGRTGFPSELRDHDVIVTTYETAVRDLSMLKMIDWSVMVLDEAQAIKNPDSYRARSLVQIGRRNTIAVSGTPFENRLRDIWSIMEFVCPGVLGSLEDFESRFDESVESAVQLEPIVSSIMLRRHVADVASDLPERIDVSQPVELSERGAREYDNLRQQIVAEFGRQAPLVSITKLRKFCTHPFLEEPRQTSDPALWSVKYVRLLEILDEIVAVGQKALIFTSYTRMTDILVEDLARRYGIYSNFIDGRVNPEVRQPLVDDFQAHQGAGVLVLNPRAGGTGLNITAANHVIHYNLEWNPSSEDQASARAYRRGQELPVTIHRLFYVSTIEEVIVDRVQRKRDMAEAAIVGTDGKQVDFEDLTRALELSPL